MGKVVCKSCGSHESIRLEYGMPDEVMIKKIEKGEVMHGGCVVAGLTQDFYCLHCNAKFDKHSSEAFLSSLKTIVFNLSRTDKGVIKQFFWRLEFTHDDVYQLNGFSRHFVFREDGQIMDEKVGIFVADMHEVVRQLKEIGLEYWLEEYHGEETLKQEVWTLELIAPNYPIPHAIKKGYHHKPYTMVKWCRLLKKFNLSDQLFK